MRPAGEVHLAMLQAAHAIKRERIEAGKGATLRELAERACVGYAVARTTMRSLKRGKHLQAVGTCKVPGRNRPALVYAPVDAEVLLCEPDGVDALACVLSGWVR